MTTLKITLPDSTTIELLPVPRAKLPDLREKLVNIAYHWMLCQFSTGDTALNDDCWEEMKAAIAMLPRKDNPAMGWEDLDLISGDYEQLEKIFFCQEKQIVWTVDPEGSYYAFDGQKYKAGLLTELHLFSPMRILQDARLLLKG